MLISIRKTAAILGVSISTLQRWDKEGIVLAITRTEGGPRRYELTAVLAYACLKVGEKTVA